MKALAFLPALLCAGCVSVPVGVHHMSHISQHWPFDGPNDTDKHQYNDVYIGLTLQPVHDVPLTITLTDGYSWDKIDGRREVFDARIQYDIPLGGYTR